VYTGCDLKSSTSEVAGNCRTYVPYGNPEETVKALTAALDEK